MVCIGPRFFMSRPHNCASQAVMAQLMDLEDTRQGEIAALAATVST